MGVVIGIVSCRRDVGRQRASANAADASASLGCRESELIASASRVNLAIAGRVRRYAAASQDWPRYPGLPTPC